ncbi:MAG: LLM class flavin-dependent oxidoreductase [Thermomicrobiales bacterium]
MGSRGFGVAGNLDRAIIAELASGAEAAGYSTFWANDTPDGDGLEALATAARATATIRLGVGVLPVDRLPAETIVARIRSLDLPESRLTIGIGSGSLRVGAIGAVAQAAERLRALTSAKIVIGALGPKMCAAAGAHADGVLLNWLTPEFAIDLRRIAETAAADKGAAEPWIGAYVRTALPGPGSGRLIEEGTRYASYPQYGAHFTRMGVQPVETCAMGDGDAIGSRLRAFDAAVDETVVRAVAAAETLNAYLAVLRAGSPAIGVGGR